MNHAEVVGLKWRFRSCRRCGGDLYRDVSTVAEGSFGVRDESWACLQCGHREGEEELAVAGRGSSSRRS